MNISKPVLGVAFALFLAGCSSTMEQTATAVVAPPTDSQLCCSSYSQLPLAQLSDNEELSFDIDAASPVATFPEGNSYFSAFRFSERSSKVEVTLSSDLLNGQVFAPQIALFDSKFNLVKVVNLDDFTVLPSDAFTRSHFITKFRTDAEVTPYFAIYTPSKKVGQSIQIDHPAKVRAKEFGEPMPMTTDPIYVYHPTGSVDLKVSTLKLRPFKVAPVSSQTNLEMTKSNNFAQPETKNFYISAIENAVNSGDIPKALSLLEEAKAINVEGAQEAFVKAVNAK